MEDRHKLGVLGIFFNEQHILEYFHKFHCVLQEAGYSVDKLTVSKFLTSLQYLEENHFFQSSTKIRNYDEFNSILVKIFYTLHDKCLQVFLSSKQFEESADVRSLVFDSIALLLKILMTEAKQNISLKCLFEHLINYFDIYSTNHNKYFDACESGKEQYHDTLKFLVKVFKSLHLNVHMCVSDETVTQLLKSIPLNDKYSVNMLIYYLLPQLLTSENNLRKHILDFLWKRIVFCFEQRIYNNEESYPYSLLCCFAEYTFQKNWDPENFNIHDGIIWKIIQSGLISNNACNRKQAIYVFKLILFWLKTANIFSASTEEVPLFSIKSSKDLLIWNDLMVLFEVLEEKQVHVIKPVLPKFSRILQYATKRHYSSHKESYFLHPSWIICCIRRLLIHESKYIIKQGIFLAMNLNFQDLPMHLMNTEVFMQEIIEALNDQNMFCRMNENDNLSLFLSSEKMLTFLSAIISAYETNEQKVDFVRYLLKLTASQSWCGVALLHLIFSLSNLDGLPSWKSNDILYLRKIVQISFKIYEPILRRAVEYWLLKSCILLFDWNSLCFEDLSELLLIFPSFYCRTEMWSSAVSKLKEIIAADDSANLSIHKAKVFSVNCIEKILSAHTGNENFKEHNFQKIARMLLILADCHVISTDIAGKSFSWHHLLHPLTTVLVDAPKRPYMSQEKFYAVLQFYSILISESQKGSEIMFDIHTTAIINCLNFSAEFIEYIFQKLFLDLKDSDDVSQFQILVSSVSVFASVNDFYELFLKLLPSILTKCYNVTEHLLSGKVVIILLYSILNFQLSNTKAAFNKLQSNPFQELNYNLLSKIVNEDIINELSKCVFVNEYAREIWLKLSTNATCDFWRITCQTIEFLSPSDLKSISTSLFQLAEDTFIRGSKLGFTYAVNCIQVLIPKLDLVSIPVIKDLLNVAWKACSELHGSELYRPSFNSFVQAVFQPCMLNERYFGTLYHYLDCFQKLSENTLGNFYFVVKQFCNVFSMKDLFTSKFNFIPFLVCALTYGPIHNKGQKILEDTITYISKHDENFSLDIMDYNKPSIFVRIIVCSYLMKHLFSKSPQDEEIVIMLIDSLLELDDSTRKSKSSKFANSFSHRVRNRIWQIILLLQPNLLSIKENESFLRTVLNCLEFENQQPSIRYLQEWLILKILIDHRCFINDFISLMENSLDKRPGLLTSLVSILIHLIIHNFIVSEEHAYRCFPIVINYCMAQNFAVRLYARLALTKLFAFCENQNFTGVIQKYDFLHSLLSQQSESALLEKGNIYKNLSKLSEDFYFSTFHPIHHFTLETIFFELPRLSNVTSEEWIKPTLFTYQDGSLTDFPVPCYNTDDCLKNCSATSWSEKLVDESVVVENESFDYNFQKKICPTRSERIAFDPDIDLFNICKQEKSNLIVIASLIDRIPNLGGLCRTCEIFGIEKFVIGSLKYIEDKQFQNLSVSADRWISIKEVKPYNLKEYLLLLKEEGYTLIGAEQTDDSHKLNDYVFPKKSALLLGHEKEGMPVDLIQLLDVCVEIPQQGIIRSLNVHVSGAIFIWEYARQQIKQIL